MISKLTITIFVLTGFALADYIDFTDRDAYRSVIHNQQSAEITIEVDGQPVDMTISASVGTMTWNCDNCNNLEWRRDDGIGISYSYEYDEIESNEVLRVEFSEELLLSSVSLTDLFNENGYLEQGSYSLSDGTNGSFLADASQVTSNTNGEKNVDINKVVSWIELSAPGYMDGEHHEFSLAGLTVVSSVPEVSSLFSLGFFLVLAVFYRFANRKVVFSKE